LGGAQTAEQFDRGRTVRSEEHTSELQSQSNLVCRLLLEKKKYPTRVSAAGVSKTTYDSVQNVQNAYWNVFCKQPEIAADVLTPTQLSLLPMFENISHLPY